jgi:putative sigma-54 modulation protein
MNIIIKTKNIEMTPALREFVEEKIGSLEKYFNIFQGDEDPALKSEIDAVVEVGKTTLHHRKGNVCRAEILLSFHKNTMRAAKSADDLKKAVVEACNDLQRQITAFKEKTIDKSRK